MYPKADGPRYITGGAVLTASCLLVAVGAFVLRLYAPFIYLALLFFTDDSRIHIKENNKLEQIETDNVVQEGDARAAGFRYVY